MVRIVVLNDNRCLDGFLCEHGLSLYIEVNNKKILFDVGQSNIFIENAKKLNVDLNKIDDIVLSHGDYDHSNGLKYLNVETNLIVHPDCFLDRVSKRTGQYAGLNLSKLELEKKFNVISSRTPYYLSNDLIFLGEIPRVFDFENEKNLPMKNIDGNTYKHLDDSALVINTNNGLFIVAGCSHSGICNIINYAKKVTGVSKIDTIIGGFHLKDIDEQTIKTIEYLKDNKINHLMLAHCTSDIVCDYFSNELPYITEIIKTGKVYEYKYFARNAIIR